MTGHILFVDNDPDFLNTRAEFLKREGYEIFKALTISEAAWFLENANIHLAIVDVRMQDDDDERDVSGLSLVTQEVYRSVHRIILTGHPSTDTARIALKPQPSGRGLAIDYLKKEDAPETFIQAVHDVFAHHVRINWNLHIDWKARDPFALVNLIEPGLEGERLLNRAEELEDLFRRLFYEKEYLRIERLLWQRDGRLALVVLAFKEGLKPESLVVVCGQNAIVNEEAQRFASFAPKASGEAGTHSSARAETTHFAANAYTLVGNDLGKVQTLGELYRFTQETIFKVALNTLFQKTLQAWHQDKPVWAKNDSLEALYSQRLGLSAKRVSIADFEERIKVIETQLPTLGPRIERTGEKLTFHFNGQSFPYPDPLPLLAQMPDTKGSALVVHVPGTLTGENILVDEIGRAWLTDFAEAGQAPLLWNFVALEAVIRFDLVETNDILRRQEMEHRLINTDFAKPDTRDLEPIVRKPGRAIQTIRKLAARTVGRDTMAYHRGIFFHAACRLANFNPAYPLTSSELARLAHVLLSLAMIAEKIEEGKANTSISTAAQTGELRIVDEIARTILIGNQEVRLAPQPFALFRYLYLNANRVCTKEELVKEVLKGEYEEEYLHTLVGRIRKAIEDDPEQPRYIITIPNAGYRLITKPE